MAYSGTWGDVAELLLPRRRGPLRERRPAGARPITVNGFAVAWISTAGSSRGSARVYADGVLQGTYSTYRSSAVYRRVVTHRTFAETGTHTYRVEVKGTAGHPRVDVDAFVVLR